MSDIISKTLKKELKKGHLFYYNSEIINPFLVMVRVGLDCGIVVVDGRLVGLASQGIPVPSVAGFTSSSCRTLVLSSLGVDFFGLLSTPVTLVLCRVDFSVSSFNLDTDRNINVDISKVSFVKMFYLTQVIQSVSRE